VTPRLSDSGARVLPQPTALLITPREFECTDEFSEPPRRHRLVFVGADDLAPTGVRRFPSPHFVEMIKLSFRDRRRVGERTRRARRLAFAYVSEQLPRRSACVRPRPIFRSGKLDRESGAKHRR